MANNSYTSVSALTYYDAFDWIIDAIGGDSSGRAKKIALRAIHSALRTITSHRDWTYFNVVLSLNLQAPYSTGTIAYDHSGGIYERQVTLTGGTWPSWAGRGTLVLDGGFYEVDEVKSSTILTLKKTSNPGEDVASGTAFTLVQEAYLLPDDFVRGDQLRSVDVSGYNPIYLPSDQFVMKRTSREYSSVPRYYTIMGDPWEKGRLAIYFYPPPSLAYNYELSYQRDARALRILDHSTGTVSLTAGSSTVTGSGTNWSSALEGAIFRASSDSSTLPGSIDSLNPFEEEHEILSVDSATSLTLKSSVSKSLSGVAYRISDPIDLSLGPLRDAFLHCTEWWWAKFINASREDIQKRQQSYVEMLRIAMERDAVVNRTNVRANQRALWELGRVNL